MECFYSISLPDHGVFDVDALAKQLSADPAVVRYPGSKEIVFIVCTSPEAAARLQVKLHENPTSPCDTYGVITLKSNAIWISQDCSPMEMKRVVEFVMPLLKEKNCRIGNENGDDITERYQGNFESLFYHKVPRIPGI